MFFWNLMNEQNRSNKQDNAEKMSYSLPFPMPFPFVMPPLFPWTVLWPFFYEETSPSQISQEMTKKIAQELISIDSTPEELEKLQIAMNQIYEIYTNNKAKKKNSH